MNANQIFEKKQLLTVERAKQLFGKKIATTAPEYRGNSPIVKIFVVGEITTQWDEVAKEQWTQDNRFRTRQEYWASFMTEKEIDEKKTNLVLLTQDGERCYTAHTKYWNFFDVPTFTGSDADRPVFYVEL
jgi:hypothetical protein